MSDLRVSKKPFSVTTVPEGEDAQALLGRKLELYSDEKGVSGRVISKKVRVTPLVVCTVEFVLLWRNS